MAESRIGVFLRAARTRAGWSREALAFHSGVSWSAIAQIESGRRKDVRLSSLSALADALGVSVDYLIGTEAAAATPQMFDHRVLTYRSDEEFVASTVPFLEEGIEAGDCLLAVATKSKTRLLGDALGDRSAQVEFADWAKWYESPSTALDRYGEFVKRQVNAGATWIRVVAEAAWTGSSDEMSAWARYESLVNLVFASSPTTIVCTYDERAFHRGDIAEARNTHPLIAHCQDAVPSADFRHPHEFLLSTGREA